MHPLRFTERNSEAEPRVTRVTMIKLSGPEVTEDRGGARAILVKKWTEEVTRLVPTNYLEAASGMASATRCTAGSAHTPRKVPLTSHDDPDHSWGCPRFQLPPWTAWA